MLSQEQQPAAEQSEAGFSLSESENDDMPRQTIHLASPNSQPPDDRDTKWHLDRRVPLAIIFALIMQSATIVWWASGQVKDNQFQDREIVELKQKVSDSDVGRRETDSRLARVEEKLGAVVDVLHDIRDSIKDKYRGKP